MKGGETNYKRNDSTKNSSTDNKHNDNDIYTQVQSGIDVYLPHKVSPIKNIPHKVSPIETFPTRFHQDKVSPIEIPLQNWGSRGLLKE